MSKTAAIANHVTNLSLWLIGFANILFLLAFLVTLLALGGQARAQGPACTGVDMIAALQQSDPQKLAQIRAEAAKTPNGEGRLWKIEKSGVEPSYLFGTMHMTDPRVVALPAAAEQAFAESDIVVIETTDILDQAKMLASLMQDPSLMMFTDDTTLKSLMSPEDAAATEAALEKRGIPLASVVKMKPWALAAMVSLPACELARKAGGAPVLDVNLAMRAEAEGKALGGLETAKSQIEAIASLPLAFHVEGLVETLKLGDRMDDVIETMIDLYLKGDTGMFWPFFHAVLPPGDGSDSGYAAFEEKMITARNATMAKAAETFLDRGRAFIAVGALHLPGAAGLVEQLRRAGYAVSRAD